MWIQKGKVIGSCEYGNEPSGPIKREEGFFFSLTEERTSVLRRDLLHELGVLNAELINTVLTRVIMRHTA
jgi:hypothetical protein